MTKRGIEKRIIVTILQLEAGQLNSALSTLRKTLECLQRSLVNHDRKCCANGHPWTSESTVINAHGCRECRTCRRDRNRIRSGSLIPLGEESHRGERSLYCRRGHMWTPENTYINTIGYRECRECRRTRSRIEYANKKMRMITRRNRDEQTGL